MAKLLVLVLSLSVGIFAAAVPNVTELHRRQGGYQTERYTFSFYGYPDSNNIGKTCQQEANEGAPQGSNTIAYPGCAHNGGHRGAYAGGDGSYANPVTAATYLGSGGSYYNGFSKCEVFFSPFLEKFFIIEDLCPSCIDAAPHVDIWIGGAKGNSDSTFNKVCDREDSLTPGSTDQWGWGEACVFFNFNGDAINDLNNNRNQQPMWDGTNCNWASQNWYWTSNNGNFKNICGPSG